MATGNENGDHQIGLLWIRVGTTLRMVRRSGLGCPEQFLYFVDALVVVECSSEVTKGLDFGSCRNWARLELRFNGESVEVTLSSELQYDCCFLWVDVSLSVRWCGTRSRSAAESLLVLTTESFSTITAFSGTQSTPRSSSLSDSTCFGPSNLPPPLPPRSTGS